MICEVLLQGVSNIEQAIFNKQIAFAGESQVLRFSGLISLEAYV